MTPIERRLLDELQIQKLAASYSHATLKLDGAAAAAVYTEDGILSAFYYPDVVGRAAIAEALTKTLAPLQFLVQNCGAGMIDIEGDTARASWSVTELLRYKDSEAVSCCFGTYEDQLVRTGEGWRFARRSFIPFYRGSMASTGKLYRDPEFANAFSPWPFLGRPLDPA